MIELKPRDGSSNDPDGVRVVAREGRARRGTLVYQGLALLFVAACIGYVVTPRRVPPGTGAVPDASREIPEASLGNVASAAGTAPAATTAGAPGVAKAPAAASTRALTPRRAASHRPSQDPPEEADANEIQPNEALRNITAGEYIQALHDAGIYEGIGAFPPPGTSPPLEGIAVPPDYELPEGYVRHFQTTDDGQAIDPILMYSPDYEFLDENGNPVAIPEDRVVPADHAPPGMPVRVIEIPKPREPGDLSR